MAGPGSGGWFRCDKNGIVEDHPRIDVRALHREHGIIPGSWVTVQHEWQGEQMAQEVHFLRPPAILATISNGESAEWVARTLGHVTTSMGYKTYGRYIPNLTGKDGLALERLFADTGNKRQPG